MKCKRNKTRNFQEGGGIGNWSPMITRSGQTLGNFYNTLFNLDEELDKKDDLIEDEIDELNKTQFRGSNATLSKMSTQLPIWENVDVDDLGGETDLLGTGIESFTTGYATGMQAGIGPLFSLIPAAADTLVNVTSGAIKNRKLNEKVDQLNKRGREAEKRVVDNLNSAIYNTDVMNDRWRLQNMYNTNYAAFGGLLETNGADWKTGASFIDNGGTHQENPFGGVQFGIASDGLPNLVEEGEVVIKVQNNPNQGHSFEDGGSSTYDDYVVSNREFPTLEEIANANITKTPEKYEGMSWAAIYKDIFDKSHIKEVINRQDSKDYIDILNERVAQAHEITRLRNQQEAIMNRLKKATPEEQDLILQQAGYPNLIEEATMAAHGGKIYIKPSHRGKLTALKKRTGKTEAELWRTGSPSVRKMITFARNARKWKHEDGGYLFPWGGWANQDELNNYYTQQYTDFWNNLQGRKGRNVNSAYLTGAQARQWINQLSQGDEQQQALANMLKNQWGDSNTDWSDNATWEFKNKYNPSGTIIESSPYISWAGNNTAMKDALWGIKHVPQLSVDSRYQQGNYTPSTPEIILPAGPQSINRYWTYDWNTGERTPITEAEFNNPDEGWFVDDTLTEYGPDSEDDINAYKDLYLTNRTSNTNVNNNELDGKGSVNGGINMVDGLLSTLNGLNVALDLAGITNVADYSNANRVERAILPPTLIGYNPNGRYVKPLLTDKRYIASRLGNQGAAAIGAAKDLSGSDRATALNNIALNNYLNNLAIGQAMAQTDEANNAALREAITLNNQVDRANAEGILQADRANQSAKEAYANRYADQKTKGAKMREDIDEQVSKNRSANWNNLLENLQGYFDNQRNRNMANSAYQGTGYNIDRRGNIRYTPDYDKASKAEKKNIESNDKIDQERIKKGQSRNDLVLMIDFPGHPSWSLHQRPDKSVYIWDSETNQIIEK